MSDLKNFNLAKVLREESHEDLVLEETDITNDIASTNQEQNLDSAESTSNMVQPDHASEETGQETAKVQRATSTLLTTALSTYSVKHIRDVQQFSRKLIYPPTSDYNSVVTQRILTASTEGKESLNITDQTVKRGSRRQQKEGKMKSSTSLAAGNWTLVTVVAAALLFKLQVFLAFNLMDLTIAI
jgi:hypothetical protein